MNRLRELREARGVSQEALANAALTSVGLIRQIERYDRAATPMARERLAAALGSTVAEVWTQIEVEVVAGGSSQ